MASFLAKICRERQRKSENKNYHSIMASFQAKIYWKKPRKIDNKNYRFVSFLPEGLEKIPKK